MNEMNTEGTQAIIKLAIPITGRGHRLTDGGEVVSLMCPSPFNRRKIPGNHFCYRLSRPHGHSVAGRTR
jgi:hypothetical protein